VRYFFCGDSGPQVFAGSTVKKNCLPVAVPFFVGIRAHDVCRQYGLKTCLPVAMPFFGENLGPQFLQAVRFKNLLLPVTVRFFCRDLGAESDR
jgi:hypothetical protein